MALPDQRQDGSQVGTPDSVGWRLMVAIILSSLMGVGGRCVHEHALHRLAIDGSA